MFYPYFCPKEKLTKQATRRKKTKYVYHHNHHNHHHHCHQNKTAATTTTGTRASTANPTDLITKSTVLALNRLEKLLLVGYYNKIQWQEKIRNEDLWERAGQEPVAKQTLRRKWGWIGHTLRKPASSTTRQALTWNPQGKRRRGRPRNSCRRDTEAELKQQWANWSGMTRAAQNRVRWRGVVDGLFSTGSDGHK